MLSTILTVLMIWACHTFADFVLQTHEQATKKSVSNYYLGQHTGTYAFAMTVFAFVLFNMNTELALAFGAITWVAHTATDYVTSRWSKKYFSKQDFHNGFVVIGFDQFLHLTQLLLTYYFLLQTVYIK